MPLCGTLVVNPSPFFKDMQRASLALQLQLGFGEIRGALLMRSLLKKFTSWPSFTSPSKSSRRAIQSTAQQGLIACLLVVASTIAASTCVAGAQESIDRGVISGYVSDSTGAMLPDSVVTITNSDTGVSTTVKSNNSGYYELRQLIPGNYRVKGKHDGFAVLEQTNIYLDAGHTTSVKIALKPGSIVTTVVVTANENLLNTQEGNNPSIIDAATVRAVPIGDNYAGMMVKLQQGIQSTDPISSTTAGAMWSSGGNSAFGVYGMYKASEFTFDGAPNDIHLHQQNYAAAVDETKEIETEAAGFDATVGHTLGAGMNVVSMNGTNAFHGALRSEYEDLRWQPLNRTNRLAYQTNTAVPCEPPNENSVACQAAETKYGQLGLHNLTYAASIGGPVIIPHLFNGRDKLFFFMEYMKDTIPTLATGLTTVPTTQELTGNFSDLPCPTQAPTSGNGTYNSPYVWATSAYSYPCPAGGPPNAAWGYGAYQIYDPLTTTPDGHGGYIRKPFAGNIVPAARQQNPLGPFMAKQYLVPNTPDSHGSLADTNNFTYALKQPQVYTAYSPRIDYALDQSNHFFFHEAIGHWVTTSPDPIAASQIGAMLQGRYFLVLTGAWDHTFSPRLTMTTTLSYNRYKAPNYYNNAPPSSAALGLPSYLDTQAQASYPNPAPVSQSISGYRAESFSASTLNQYVKTNSVNVDLVGVFGRHALKFGGAYRLQSSDNVNLGASGITAGGNSNDTGTLTYDNTYTSIASDSAAYISSESTLGPAYAAMLLGFQTSASQGVGVNDARSNPYGALYVQDSWRLTPRLTINAGLRFEYEAGPTASGNEQVGAFDPTQALAIAPGANAAYSPGNYAANSAALAAAGLPSTLPGTLNVVGGATYAGVNGVDTKQWQDSYRYLPRLAAAYSLTPKTVIRTGYGLFFDALNNLNEGNDQTGYSISTSQPSSLTSGTSWVAPGVSAGTTSPTLNPFPTGFAVPFGNSGGNLIYAGGSQSFFPHNLVPARQQRWQGSVQHQVGRDSVLTVIYSGAFTSKINGYGAGSGAAGPATLGVNLNAVPGSYYTSGQTAATTQSTVLGTQVSNPFNIVNLTGLTATQHSLLATGNNASFFNSPTIALSQLLKPYPHLSGLTELAPVGESKFEAVEATYSKRYSANLNFNIDYQRTFQYDRDWFANTYDQLPSWEDSQTNSRPSRLTGTGIWKLPFGKGQRFVHSSEWTNKLAGGWQYDASYEVQQGPLIVFGNVFYTGCTTSWKTCDTTGLKEKSPTYGEWFNTNGFNTATTPGTYNNRVFPHVVNGVRANGDNNWNMNITKTTSLREGVNLELRLEALNVFNHLVAGAPNTSPTSSQFGQVTTDTYTTGRWVQIQGRIYF